LPSTGPGRPAPVDRAMPVPAVPFPEFFADSPDDRLRALRPRQIASITGVPPPGSGATSALTLRSAGLRRSLEVLADPGTDDVPKLEVVARVLRDHQLLLVLDDFAPRTADRPCPRHVRALLATARFCIFMHPGPRGPVSAFVRRAVSRRFACPRSSSWPDCDRTHKDDAHARGCRLGLSRRQGAPRGVDRMML
jgi:hypothetical protein